jgi:hypothetical protein
VPNRDFLFAVDLAEGCRFDDMLIDLASRLITRAGCAHGDVADLVTSMSAELDRQAGSQAARRAVRFSAGEGQLQIVVFQADGREWRVGRPLL